MGYPIAVPDIGDFSGVEVLEVLVKTGDTVAREDALITLESDKATMDVPSPRAGVITAVKVKVGDKVSQGDIIAEIDEADSPAQSGGDKAADEKSPSSQGGEKAAADSAASQGGQKPAEDESSATQAAAKAAADSSAPSSSPLKSVAVRVPDIGDFSEVPVIEILVKVGDMVAREDALITLESDKATLDVPSPAAGRIEKIAVKVGDKVSQGDVVLHLATAESEAAESTSSKSATAPPQTPPREAPLAELPQVSSPPPLGQTPPPSSEEKKAVIYASPAVRRVAREFGVDLAAVSGSGRKGRILKEDVQSFVRERLSHPAAGDAPMPRIDFAQFGEIEFAPLSRIKKLSAANILRNWRAAPQVTQFIEADITGMEAFRKTLAEDPDARGHKVSPLCFLVKAAAFALIEFPEFNSSLAGDGENLVLKKYRHIGFAADTKQGLVVPVLRDADQKGILQIAAELAELAARAREGKLARADMQGGCFTISSLGGIGGGHFTPILNLPEAAILGVSRAQTAPKWDGKTFAPRLILPLSLTYDHRIIDGAAGARFAVYLADILSDIRRLAL
jgi:pyruvate dehydrogenase E2 component (dihydrolipoamide acetyltransferase)